MARDGEGTAACARFRLTSLPHAAWPPWSPFAMSGHGLPQKGVAQSVLSLSVRQCWHAHPELSFDTCKWLCKEFNRTLTTLSGEAPWRPWALPVRRKSLTVVREFLHLAYLRLSLRATFSI